METWLAMLVLPSQQLLQQLYIPKVSDWHLGNIPKDTDSRCFCVNPADSG